MRHPANSERFLMSRSLAPALVTADDIMEFTLDCEPCEARGRNGFLERFIHGEIFKARPDVMAATLTGALERLLDLAPPGRPGSRQ